MSLARQLLILQLVVVALTVTIGAAVTVRTARQDTQEQERDRVLAVSETLAQAPAVIAALDDRDPSRVLQPLAERVRRRTGVSFVVVMSPRGIRYSHPNPRLIGRHFIGDIAPALRGRPFTETYTGTLGPSVRSVVPVERGGRVIGLVSAGVLQEEISAQIARQLPELIALAAVALLVGAALSLLLARRVKRQTLGLEPRRIARLYEHDQAVLHAIREGVLVLDRDGCVLLANDEARRLLGLPADVEGRPVRDAVTDGSLRELLAGGGQTRDALHLVGDRVLVVNQSEARVDGRLVGAVATLRDRTELQDLGRELDTVRGLADSLRAQAHESANQLHTIVGLVELGRYEEAVAFATEQVEVAQELLSGLQERIDEPALVALLLGKTALARERGAALEVDSGSRFAATGLPSTELVTIVGNLIDNALDALADRPGAEVGVTLRTADGEALIEVRDNGPGIPDDALERVFEAGWSTKRGDRPRGLGLALVRQAAARLDGTADARNDGGAVFTVRLPLPAGAPAASEGARAGEASLR